ncbi:MAG TPA: hypothetical protein GX706_03185 [Candidatus Moranbacteria bacterium]|nr:hypothetical protein [Candidatus Moranbacteria bacterium]
MTKYIEAIKFDDSQDFITECFIFEDLIFEFFIFLCGIRSLADLEIRNRLKDFEDQLISSSFIEYFDKKSGLIFKPMDRDGKNFQANLNIKSLLDTKSRSLIIGAFEIIEKKKLVNKLKNKDPNLFCFFRHIRNAAAHDGIINLKNKDGSWRSDLDCYFLKQKIDKSKQGVAFESFFKYTDVLILIYNLSIILSDSER